MARKPVMVFAGEFWAGASGAGLSTGFRDLGWAVQEVDRRDFGVRPSGSVPFRLASRLTRTMAAGVYRRKLLEECRALKPDVFLTIKGTDVTGDLLRQLKAEGACTVMYYPDVAFDHSGVSPESFSDYDLFITTKTFQMQYLEDMLGKNRVHYVPHGYSGGIQKPIYSGMVNFDYQVDISYVGNYSPYKRKWMEGAVASLPGVTSRIVGNGWQKNAGRLLACRTMPRARTGMAYVEMVQTARINIAVHFGPMAHGWEDRVSRRTFEIPACRGFMLHIDNDEVRDFFEPGVEIDVFSSPEELADKIRFYLARPELRARMIERAHARCVPAYSHEARARQIAALLQVP